MAKLCRNLFYNNHNSNNRRLVQVLEVLSKETVVVIMLSHNLCLSNRLRLNNKLGIFKWK